MLRDSWTPEVYMFDASAADASAVASARAIRARMFAPSLGIGEDPATGSAAACLAAYLARHEKSDGHRHWTIEQGFEMGRPSILSISAETNGGRISAICVAGKSVLVSQGTLRVG
jgi:trans-2,3-dihydro-3-hydroxyanthranilate isomerase